MTVFKIIVLIYLLGGVVSGVITWRVSRDKFYIRLLSALLIGATWPLSFPVVLFFSLF